VAILSTKKATKQCGQVWLQSEQRYHNFSHLDTRDHWQLAVDYYNFEPSRINDIQ